MNALLQRLMEKATLLTRNGKLHAATEAIQRALQAHLPGAQDKADRMRFPPMAIPRNSHQEAQPPQPVPTSPLHRLVLEGVTRFVDEPIKTTPDTEVKDKIENATRPVSRASEQAFVAPPTTQPTTPPVAPVARPAEPITPPVAASAPIVPPAPTLAPPIAPIATLVTPYASSAFDAPKAKAATPPEAIPFIAKAPVAAPPLFPAEPEQWTAGSFANTSQTLAYKLYLPPRQAGNTPVTLPLILMLHGCSQNPDDFAAGTQMNALARKHGFVVLYPQQTQHANSHKCWNWFKTQHQQRDRGEPALLAALTQTVMGAHAIDASRVYVAGLSAGGAMADIMARCYPDVFAAVGVHSGLPTGAAGDVMSALSVMRNGTPAIRFGGKASPMPPTIVFHGDADTTVHPRNGAAVVSAARGTPSTAGEPRVTTGQSLKGQRFTRTEFPPAPGQSPVEEWVLHGAGHAWSGGHASGTYTDPSGADASGEMLRFFMAHPMGQGAAPVA